MRPVIAQREARPVTIMTVPTSQLLDPWAPYRAKVQELRAAQKKARGSRKKKQAGGANSPEYVSLWAALEEAGNAREADRQGRRTSQRTAFNLSLWPDLDL